MIRMIGNFKTIKMSKTINKKVHPFEKIYFKEHFILKLIF